MGLNIPDLNEEVISSDDSIGPKMSKRKNSNQQELHCSYWVPSEKAIRGLVYLCHGYAEHLQWYEKLALELNKIGLLAFGHDHIGHGRSAGTKGDIYDFDEYVVDVLDHCEAVKSQFTEPELPLFIVGHSLGGLITIRSAQRKPTLFSGAVLMGPLVEPDKSQTTPLKTMAVKYVAAIFPLLPVVSLKLSAVTRDEEIQERLSKDPLRYHGGVRARFAYQSSIQVDKLKSDMDAVTWPFLILHGENDTLCSPTAAQKFCEDAPSDDKKFKMFPSAVHNLFIEIPEVREEALSDTVNWISKRIPGSLTDVDN